MRTTHSSGLGAKLRVFGDLRPATVTSAADTPVRKTIRWNIRNATPRKELATTGISHYSKRTLAAAGAASGPERPPGGEDESFVEPRSNALLGVLWAGVLVFGASQAVARPHVTKAAGSCAITGVAYIPGAGCRECPSGEGWCDGQSRTCNCYEVIDP